MSSSDGKVRDLGRIPDAKPPRPHRSALGRVLYSLFLALSVFALIGFGLMAWGYKSYTSPGPLAAAKVFEIQKGLRTPEIASVLLKEGIIADAQVFTVAASVSGVRAKLRAGEYEFPASATMRDVLNIIQSGKAILYKVSIPEGWTTWQALERIKANEVLTGELTAKPAEGDILPDTYLFRRGKSRDELVAEMVTAQNKVMKDLWEKRSAAIAVKTPQEAIVLASIVEKETGVAEERPRIAAVFGNRLEKGMRLQSDPTIIYGITKGQGKLDRSLRRSDIAEETPYNTYRIKGLPPGPIANPGKAALEAVLNPLKTKEIFFVADGSGGHAFAETLEAHNANVKKWREVESNQGQVSLTEEAVPVPEPPAAPAAPAPAGEAIAEAPAADAPPVDAPAPGTVEELAPAGAPAPAAAPAKTAEQLKREETPPDPAAIAAEEDKKAADAATAEDAARKIAAAKLAADQKAAEAAKKAAEQAKAEAAKKAEEQAKADAAKKAEEAAAKAEAPKVAEATLDLKPGSLIKLAKRLVPIPKPKPRAN